MNRGGISIFHFTKISIIEGLDILLSLLVSNFYGFIGSCSVVIFSHLIVKFSSYFNMQNNYWITSMVDVSDICTFIMFIIFCFFGILSLLINTYKSIKKSYRDDNVSTVAQDVGIINQIGD
jgi:hypothetical protein